jgi:Na+/H+-dicarboxylate symporter
MSSLGGAAMTAFEFVFALFALMLGLSLAEVLAGLGRAVEARVRARQDGSPVRAVRIGWLTSLLGLFVAFDLLFFWTSAWMLRDSVRAHYFPMLFGLAATGAYYFAATLIFPRDLTEWRNLDDHYDLVKRWVIAVVAACNLLLLTGTALVGINPVPSLRAAVLTVAFFALLVGIALVRSRRANLTLLALGVAQYPLFSLVNYLS